MEGLGLIGPGSDLEAARDLDHESIGRLAYERSHFNGPN